jgi:hypothetical protein
MCAPIISVVHSSYNDCDGRHGSAQAGAAAALSGKKPRPELRNEEVEVDLTWLAINFKG